MIPFYMESIMDQIVHIVEYVGQATFVMHINDSWM